MSKLLCLKCLKGLWEYKGVRWISLGWTGFIVENLVLSHNRDWIIDEFGESAYTLSYSCLSTAACCSIAYGYIRYGRGRGPQIPAMYWPVNNLPFRAAALSLQGVGAIGLSQIFPKFQVPLGLTDADADADADADVDDVEPNLKQTQTLTTGGADIGIGQVKKKRVWKAKCPVDWKASKAADGGEGEAAVQGIERVCRNPTLWALGLLSFGTAMRCASAASIAMFSFPLVFAVIGSAHKDYRYRRGSGGHLTSQMEAQTSFVPFWALLSGRQQWSDLYDEMKGLNASMAVFGVAWSMV